MYGYKLQMPKTIPKIVWACKTKVENYSWQNRNKANMIEFSICKSPKRTVVLENCLPEVLEGYTFSCVLGDELCQSYADDTDSVEIISVAISFDEITYTPKQLDTEDLNDQNVIILPRLQKDLSEQTITQFENLFYQIIEASEEHSAYSEALCASKVLRMMSEIDRIARQKVRSKVEKYIHYYVNKTESILLRRYSEKLTVKSVAKELSVSPNYLSAIFKKSTGIGFADRLLEIRMKKAAMLLMEGGLSEAEVSFFVGYEDLGHFRRRYKQYFGVSIRDYCCINKELTLYHDKPQKRSK